MEKQMNNANEKLLQRLHVLVAPKCSKWHRKNTPHWNTKKTTSKKTAPYTITWQKKPRSSECKLKSLVIRFHLSSCLVRALKVGSERNKRQHFAACIRERAPNSFWTHSERVLNSSELVQVWTGTATQNCCLFWGWIWTGLNAPDTECTSSRSTVSKSFS